MIFKFGPARFSIFVVLFVSRDLELGGVPVVSRSTKSFADFNEIWYVPVDGGQSLMHDGMPYDPIQG